MVLREVGKRREGGEEKTQEHGADKSLTMYFLSKGNNIQYYNL